MDNVIGSLGPRSLIGGVPMESSQRKFAHRLAMSINSLVADVYSSTSGVLIDARDGTEDAE